MKITLTNTIITYNTDKSKRSNLIIYNKTFQDEELNNISLFAAVFDTVKLKHINFTNSNLQLHHFTNCSFKNCKFDGVNLTEAEFTSCNFENCNFKNCKFNEAEFMEVNFLECEFNQGGLGLAIFELCNFIKTNFNGFDILNVGPAILLNSTFSNSNKSINFKGDFYLMDIIKFLDQINDILMRKI